MSQSSASIQLVELLVCGIFISRDQKVIKIRTNRNICLIILLLIMLMKFDIGPKVA